MDAPIRPSHRFTCNHGLKFKRPAKAEINYGLEDVQVLLGYEDRQAAAELLGMTYEAYCKRLFRKTILFVPVLNQKGYFIPE